MCIRDSVAAALLSHPEQGRMALASVYLPGGGEPSVVAALEAIPDWGAPLFVAGDFNADLPCPRGDSETEVALRVEQWLLARGLVAAGPAGPTRRSKDGAS
eukprot:1425096-Alexandrium_andersonii.AAC.1